MKTLISMLIILGAYILGFILGYKFNKNEIKGNNNKVIQIKEK